MKFEWEKYEKDLQTLEGFLKIVERKLRDAQEKYEREEFEILAINDYLNRNKSDIEIQVRLKQGYVEIPIEKPLPSMDDTILITRNVIETRNEKIRKQGDEIKKILQGMKAAEQGVADSEYQKLKADLTKADLEIKIRQIHLLKVKKEMHAALTKKDTRLNETELQNLQNQIESIKKNTEKRVSLYIEKERKVYEELEFLKDENDKLLEQGASLKSTVKERTELCDMMFRKNAGGAQSIDEKIDQEAREKLKF